MKVLVLVLVAGLVMGLGGCGSHAASGPAWPKRHASATDGGQSLAPRENNPVAAAAAVADDEPVLETAVAAAPSTIPAKPAEPGAAAVKPATPDEPITIEDTVIEVDE
jgi:hypothetical protein